MLWYIEEALALPISVGLHEKLKQKKIQTEKLTMKSSEDILKLDIPEYRESIGLLLKETSSLVREEARKSKKFNKPKSRLKKQGIDFIGADLRRYEIVCEDLRGKLLIAADLRASDMSFTDLLGADMRDADIRGADLSKSLFLTQAQVNTAVGDSATSLPVQLIRPTHWQ
ncbi:MAG: pentapeptide repeat-containing protein [Clostridiales bacterium]|nr:pentapeptide repeat-containing protein [Clostridiales bacterium]